MAIFTATTKQSKPVWHSPDGQREIFEVTLDVAGEPMKASTFSNDISVVGWSGEVESYEKEGKRGPQTFVRQAPKADGGGYGTGQAATQGSRSPGYQAKDEKAIQAMWAIGQAINWLTDSTPDPDDIAKIEVVAQELFAMVARVKASEEAPEAESKSAEEPVKLVDDPAPEMPEDFLKSDPWPN